MTVWLWVGFTAFILLMLALDLGVFHKKPELMRPKEAFLWTGIWVALALLFAALIYPMYQHDWLGVGETTGRLLEGKEATLEFLTGYIIEKSLSLDNIFVIALIFTHFKVPARLQHNVLVWGVLGALVMRGLMIWAGAALILRFDWITYVFGALLLFTAVKLLLARHDDFDPEKNILFRFARRLFPVTKGYESDKFFTRLNGRRAVTPLFLVLVVVESSDVLFAVDSIPAIFSVTKDPFLVFTSNVFAILGLRSLFFALVGVLDKFRYLKTSLIYILSFVGVKMLLAHHYEIPIVVSLAVILGILLVGVAASVVKSSEES